MRSTMSAEEDWLVWLEAIAAAAESKEQLHSMVDEAIDEFIKEADDGRRAQLAEALRGRQHAVGDSASRWADWPEVVDMAVTKLGGKKAPTTTESPPEGGSGGPEMASSPEPRADAGDVSLVAEECRSPR